MAGELPPLRQADMARQGESSRPLVFRAQTEFRYAVRDKTGKILGAAPPTDTEFVEVQFTREDEAAAVQEAAWVTSLARREVEGNEESWVGRDRGRDTDTIGLGQPTAAQGWTSMTGRVPASVAR